MVRLSVALVGRSRAEKLTRLLARESVNAVDAVIQQLGYDAVNRLQEKLGRAYSAVSVTCTVFLTCVSGVATASIRWKGERSEDDGESGPAEGRLIETRLGLADPIRPRWSEEGRSLRH